MYRLYFSFQHGADTPIEWHEVATFAARSRRQAVRAFKSNAIEGPLMAERVGRWKVRLV